MALSLTRRPRRERVRRFPADCRRPAGAQCATKEMMQPFLVHLHRISLVAQGGPLASGEGEPCNQRDDATLSSLPTWHLFSRARHHCAVCAAVRTAGGLGAQCEVSAAPPLSLQQAFQQGCRGGVSVLPVPECLSRGAHCRDGARAAVGKSWLTAAIPMENLHCSCKSSGLRADRLRAERASHAHGTLRDDATAV